MAPDDPNMAAAKELPADMDRQEEEIQHPKRLAIRQQAESKKNIPSPMGVVVNIR